MQKPQGLCGRVIKSEEVTIKLPKSWEHLHTQYPVGNCTMLFETDKTITIIAGTRNFSIELAKVD